MRACLSVPVSVLPIHDPADGRREQSPRLPDLGQAGSKTRGRITQRGLPPDALNPKGTMGTEWDGELLSSRNLTPPCNHMARSIPNESISASCRRAH